MDCQPINTGYVSGSPILTVGIIRITLLLHYATIHNLVTSALSVIVAVRWGSTW